MPVSLDEVCGKARAFVDSLCKLSRSESAAIPHGHYGRDGNTLLLLALEACPNLDERLLGNPIPIRTLADGQEVCEATFAEIETYARQVLEQLALRSRLSPTTPGRLPGPPQSPEAPRATYSVAEIRRQHVRAYSAWSVEDDLRLRTRFGQGATIDLLAREFGRRPGGVRSRLRKLGLIIAEDPVATSTISEPPETSVSSDHEPAVDGR